MGAAWRWLALALLVGSLGVARAEDEEDTVRSVDKKRRIVVFCH